MSRFIVRRTLAALIIAAAGCTAGMIARGADGDLSTLQQRVDRLEALTQRVEAISAIKRLQHAYGHYSELGLWHDFADLFADTGVGHYTTGRARSRGDSHALPERGRRRAPRPRRRTHLPAHLHAAGRDACRRRPVREGPLAHHGDARRIRHVGLLGRRRLREPVRARERRLEVQGGPLPPAVLGPI